MPAHFEFNHQRLFPALEALSYVQDVQLIEDDVTDSPAIEIAITDDGHGAVFRDVKRLAEQHKVVRSKPVSTIMSLDHDENVVVLQPA